MYINNYFNTTVWSEQKPEFVKSLNKATNKYIKDARTREKKFIKEWGDFGTSYHSTPLTTDNDFLDFMQELNLTIEDNLYIQCWANVMRKGDKIKKHFHSINNYDYLSGHICIQTKDTNTYYLEPYHKEKFTLKNKSGNITLFPSWIEHFTDEVLDNKERITIAFDLRNTNSMQDIYPDMKQHWSKILCL